MCVYLRAKFEVSSIIPTSVRQEEGNFTAPRPTSKRTPGKATQVRVKLIRKYHKLNRQWNRYYSIAKTKKRRVFVDKCRL